LLIWEHRDTHFKYETANPNPYTTYAASFGGVAPETRARLSIFTFKADIFLTRIQKP